MNNKNNINIRILKIFIQNSNRKNMVIINTNLVDYSPCKIISKINIYVILMVMRI